MPKIRRTYWLYPDLDSPLARRRNQRHVARATYGGSPPSGPHPQMSTCYKVQKEQANLVSSNVKGKPGIHAPALNLDIPARLVPSSTEGNSHLYLDIEVPEDKYFKLLDVMAECGILERAYVNASKQKGGTFLRPPGVKKPKVNKKVAEPEVRVPEPPNTVDEIWNHLFDNPFASVPLESVDPELREALG